MCAGMVRIVAPFLWVFTCGTLRISMSAAVVLRVLALLASAASAEGVASVALDGDSEVGSAVAQFLAARGIRVVSSAGTESVQVHVQPDPAGIRLFIYDRNGHTVERIVANAEVAVDKVSRGRSRFVRFGVVAGMVALLVGVVLWTTLGRKPGPSAAPLAPRKNHEK